MKKYIKIIKPIAGFLGFGLGLYYAHQGNIPMTIFWCFYMLCLQLDKD